MEQNSDIIKISNSEYEDLIKESLNFENNKEKTIVDGQIIAIENDAVIVDVGLKSEGRIPLTEFSKPGKDPEIKLATH